MYAESSAILVYKYGYFKTGVVESYTVRRKNKAKEASATSVARFFRFKKIGYIRIFCNSIILKFSNSQNFSNL